MDSVLQSHLEALDKAANQLIDESNIAHNVELILESAYRTLKLRTGYDYEGNPNADPAQRYTITCDHFAELYSALRLAYHVVAIGEKAQLIEKIKERKGE